MSGKPENENSATEKPTITLTGTVEKIITSVYPTEPDKAQIAVEGAEDLYRELRVENTLADEHGNTVSLKQGAHVDVTIEADRDATTSKKPSGMTPDGQPSSSYTQRGGK